MYDYLLLKNTLSDSCVPRMIEIRHINRITAVSKQHVKIFLITGEVIDLTGEAATAALKSFKNHVLALDNVQKLSTDRRAF